VPTNRLSHTAQTRFSGIDVLGVQTGAPTVSALDQNGAVVTETQHRAGDGFLELGHWVPVGHRDFLPHAGLRGSVEI
jgi:hypothetical protein